MVEEWITPKTDIPHNFGRVSNYDETVFTCERPGGELESGATIPTETVDRQIAFLNDNHIKHVLILLDQNELQDYEPPGLIALYQQAGLQTHHQPMGERGAAQNIINLLQQVHAARERIVVHCTHGMGRSGRVAAAWIIAQYKQSPQQATETVMEYAKEHGVQRLGNVDALTKWLGDTMIP